MGRNTDVTSAEIPSTMDAANNKAVILFFFIVVSVPFVFLFRFCRLFLISVLNHTGAVLKIKIFFKFPAEKSKNRSEIFGGSRFLLFLTYFSDLYKFCSSFSGNFAFFLKKQGKTCKIYLFLFAMISPTIFEKIKETGGRNI